MTMLLSALYRYPLKSCRAQALSQSPLDVRGLPQDREWMIANSAGVQITARTEPRILLICAEVTPDGLWLKAPGMADLFVALAQFNELHQADVWETEFLARRGAVDADAWLSAYLNQSVHLMWLGLEPHRRLKNHPDVAISFVDTYPLLIIGEGSLQALNARIGRELAMLRFRPNLVIANSAPFAEDTWQRIRIGEVEIELSKPCERCLMTTLDPDTAERSRDSEPLRSLAQFRKMGAAVVFGQNARVVQGGALQLGLPVAVLSHKNG